MTFCETMFHFLNKRRSAGIAVLTVLCLVVGGTGAASDLEFLEMHKDGVGAVTELRSPNACTVSADGEQLYVAATNSSAIVQFERNPVTGRLTFQAVYDEGANGINGISGVFDVALSPDGNHLYAAGGSDDAVVLFDRDTTTGNLTFVEPYYDGEGGIDGLDRVYSLAVSPDGANVYAAAITDDSVVAFARNPTTGQLDFIAAYFDGVGGVTGMDWPLSVMTDNAGNYVYVGSITSDAVVIFERTPGTGDLTFVDAFTGSGFLSFYDLAGSPDDEFLYGTDSSGDRLHVFDRNPVTGLITPIESHLDSVDGVDGLDGAFATLMDPNGLFVATLASEDSAVALFRRNPNDGRLLFNGALFDGEGGVDGLTDVQLGCVGPHGRTVYGAGWDDDAISVFGVAAFADAFEFGGSMRWSAVVP